MNGTKWRVSGVLSQQVVVNIASGKIENRAIKSLGGVEV